MQIAKLKVEVRNIKLRFVHPFIIPSVRSFCNPGTYLFDKLLQKLKVYLVLKVYRTFRN